MFNAVATLTLKKLSLEVQDFNLDLSEEEKLEEDKMKDEEKSKRLKHFEQCMEALRREYHIVFPG